jgi:DNA-binding HxlR family transcriptional regulator
MSKLENEHVWCPVDFVIHVIGSRWTIPIVRYLNSGPKRPSELSKLLNGISPKILTQRLRELETWGLVEREAFQEIPPRVTYTLSDRGRDLVFVMEALRDLGESWQRNLDIQVPPAMKEQCSHCFEYIPSDSASAAHDEQEKT